MKTIIQKDLEVVSLWLQILIIFFVLVPFGVFFGLLMDIADWWEEQ